MRLFLAIKPDGPFRESLTEMQQQMKRQGVGGNYTKPENLHLTLAFLGEYSDPDHVIEAVEAVPFSAFSIRLEGVGTFDRLYWAGLAECEALSTYAARLRWTLARQEIPFDRKKFTPHITLVRQVTLDRDGQLPQISVPRRTMRVQRVSLMRSDRGKSGMIYTEIGAVEV